MATGNYQAAILYLSGTACSLSSAVCPLQSLKAGFWTKLLVFVPPRHHFSFGFAPPLAQTLYNHNLVPTSSIGLGMCGLGRRESN